MIQKKAVLIRKLQQLDGHVTNCQKGNKQLKSNLLGQCITVLIAGLSQYYLWMAFLWAGRWLASHPRVHSAECQLQHGDWPLPDSHCSQISSGLLEKTPSSMFNNPYQTLKILPFLTIFALPQFRPLYELMSWEVHRRLPGFRHPSESAGPPGVTELMNTPRSSLPIFSPPITWNPVK